MAEKILLHACCAPCSTVPVPALTEDGFEVVAFFFNPNVHPHSEFVNRLRSMQQFVKNREISGFFYKGYPLESFLRMQLSQLESRCEGCYELRLTAAARKAKEEGIRVFSTTLLVSPYQKHELIRDLGKSVQKESRIEFLYNDWRPRWHETRDLARKEDLYLQKYCGCIFSETERYLEKEGRQHKRGKAAQADS
ncbi:MAG: epoxyqueuosine reductase QueH [Candidatus Eisenbacteria bacterium]|nr:epoxyqueuosine reductase QueH [Candidatus Eisenbacteria bacterium]